MKKTVTYSRRDPKISIVASKQEISSQVLLKADTVD